MVTHYSTNGQDSACGRSSSTLTSSATAGHVSCKSCQRSLAKPHAQSAPVKRASPSLAELRAPTPAPEPLPSLAPAAAPKRFNVANAWQQRLAELGGKSRAPRGKQQH